jgi:hypothetical protein
MNPAVLDPVEQAIMVVVALTGVGHHIAPRFHHDPFVVGNEPKRNGAAMLQQGRDIAVEVTKHGLLAVKGLRPRILARDSHRDVIRQGSGKGSPIAVSTGGEDCFHQFLIGGGAHGRFFSII